MLFGNPRGMFYRPYNTGHVISIDDVIQMSNRPYFQRIDYRGIVKSIKVSGKLPTYPSPKSTLTLTSHLGQNVELGEG